MCFTPRASAVLGHRLGLFSSESTETTLRMSSCVCPEVICSTAKCDSVAHTLLGRHRWVQEFLPKAGEEAGIDTEKCSARVEMWAGFSYWVAAFPFSISLCSIQLL